MNVFLSLHVVGVGNVLDACSVGASGVGVDADGAP